MGNRWSKFGGGRSAGDGDLELLRERVLDHAADEVAGNDIDNSSNVGPIRVIVKQDGIGRTGGIVLGVFAGMAFGVSVFALIQSKLDNTRSQEDARLAEREARMLQYYLLELDAKVIKAGIKPADESIANKLKESK